MEQIVEYKDIKKVSDITKNFATIPMEVVMDEDDTPKFTIANFNEFIERLRKILEEEYSGEIIVTQYNVATYEKEASEINKLIKQIKSNANEFVNMFASDLLGITRGKHKKDGEVQVAERLLGTYYDKIHSKTKEYRESLKEKVDVDNAIEGEIIEPNKNTTFFIAEVPNELVSTFKDFCSKNNIKLK